MQKVKLQKLGLGSYIKINAIAAAWIGLISGAIALALELCNIHVASVTVLNYSFSGLTAGIMALVIMPFAMALTFSIMSLFFGLGLKLHLFIIRGIKVKAKFKVLEDKTEIVYQEEVKKDEEEVDTDNK